MEEKKYSELSGYFTLKEWNNMSEYERMRFYNIVENYKILHSLDLTVEKPDFMRVTKRQSKEEKRPSKRKRVKCAAKMKSRLGVVPSVLESEPDGFLAAAETLKVKGLSDVRNKYGKGDIQCADNQQNEQQQLQQQQQQQSQHDDQVEKTAGSSQGTPLHLRRKRRKISLSLPELNEEPKVNSVPQKPEMRTGRPIRVGSPSEFGRARCLVEFPGPSVAPAGPSKDALLHQLTNGREKKQNLLHKRQTVESNNEISRRLGVLWKKLRVDAKECYFTASRQADEEHKRNYPGYYYSPKEHCATSVAWGSVVVKALRY